MVHTAKGSKNKMHSENQKEALEPLGYSMWANDTILDKDLTAMAGQAMFLHIHQAIFKDNCPAFCSEEMHLYLIHPQLLSPV